MEEQTGVPQLSSRPSSKTKLRLQERDCEILKEIYKRDGVVAKRHIKDLAWPNATTRAMEMRLSPLHQEGYLDWPTQEQWKTKPIPEPICWLGPQGIAYVASELEIEVDMPQKLNETQLRRLATQLRQNGIRWLREPRWSQLAHDLAVTDFTLAVEKAVCEMPSLVLEQWISEGAFHSQMDVISYSTPDSQGVLQPQKRGVCPDGYFLILDRRRESQGLPPSARLLLEIDMATHDTGNFFQRKVEPGIAYIQSSAYQARFGHNTGRWLVVTTGEVRMKHLMQQIQFSAGSHSEVFYLTTFELVKSGNVLTSPSWWQVGEDKPQALFSA